MHIFILLRIFKFLYESHKILTYLSTGKKIFFGNYSCLTFEDVKILINVEVEVELDWLDIWVKKCISEGIQKKLLEDTDDVIFGALNMPP